MMWKWSRRTISRPLCFLKKLYIRSKQVVSTLLLIYFGRPSLGYTIKTNCKRYAQFWFCRKGLGLAFLPHFRYEFSRKIFRLLYSMNDLNFIVLLSLLLEILGNMCIVIISFPACDIKNFEINLSFLRSCFATGLKKLGHKFNYLENKNSF